MLIGIIIAAVLVALALRQAKVPAKEVPPVEVIKLTPSITIEEKEELISLPPVVEALRKPPPESAGIAGFEIDLQPQIKAGIIPSVPQTLLPLREYESWYWNNLQWIIRSSSIKPSEVIKRIEEPPVPIVEPKEPPIAPKSSTLITQPTEGSTHSYRSPIIVKWVFGGTLEEATGFRVDLAKPGETFKAVSSPMWLQAFQYTILGSYFDVPGAYRLRVVPGIGSSNTVTVKVS